MSATASDPSVISLHKADRVGVAASVLCAIHCAVAPVLLIFLPAFGKIWAHPLSHALVALLVVPLAVFSIYKGYKIHQKSWVKFSAGIGVFFVLAGAVYPYVGESNDVSKAAVSPPSPNAPAVAAETEKEDCSSCEAETESCASACETECASECASTCEATADEECASEGSKCDSTTAATSSGSDSQSGEAAACVDECCPSIQVSETGEMSLHIPPAAIITTLGGIFLIAAHVGNLCYCGHGCRTKECCAA